MASETQLWWVSGLLHCCFVDTFQLLRSYSVGHKARGRRQVRGIMHLILRRTDFPAGPLREIEGWCECTGKHTQDVSPFAVTPGVVVKATSACGDVSTIEQFGFLRLLGVLGFRQGPCRLQEPRQSTVHVGTWRLVVRFTLRDTEISTRKRHHHVGFDACRRQSGCSDLVLAEKSTPVSVHARLSWCCDARKHWYFPSNSTAKLKNFAAKIEFHGPTDFGPLWTGVFGQFSMSGTSRFRMGQKGLQNPKDQKRNWCLEAVSSTEIPLPTSPERLHDDIVSSAYQ